jgi:uncharacterized repeat protein (TIGR03803 family)
MHIGRWSGCGLAVLASLWLASAAEAGAYRQLHSLLPPGDGRQPNSGLGLDASGALFGTAAGGGRYGAGTVYRLSPPGPGGARSFTVLYDFKVGTDGLIPDSAPVVDAAGNVYGTTGFGGTYGLGTVWKLAPPAAPGGAWTETILHSFAGATATPPDGSLPQAQLRLEADGSITGTTAFGGATDNGTVFRLAPDGTSTILHDFDPATGDGATPLAGLIADASGRLLGTTYLGGPAGLGTVYRLTPPGQPGGTWQEEILYAFTGGPGDGANSFSKLVQDASGTLYGTTAAGGRHGAGTVFALAADGTETILSDLGNVAGVECAAGLAMDPQGNLFGTTYRGGVFNNGTVFEVSPPRRGGTWSTRTLWSFLGPPDGANSYATLVRDASGVLYGTTFHGGIANRGSVFQVRGR